MHRKNYINFKQYQHIIYQGIFFSNDFLVCLTLRQQINQLSLFFRLPHKFFGLICEYELHFGHKKKKKRFRSCKCFCDTCVLSQIKGPLFTSFLYSH